MQVNPRETIFVGDRMETDGMAAKKLGMQFFWVNSDLNQTLDGVNIMRISDIADLLTFL